MRGKRVRNALLQLGYLLVNLGVPVLDQLLEERADTVELA